MIQKIGNCSIECSSAMDFSSSTFGGESLAIFTDKGVKVLMGVGDMIVIKEAFDHA